MADYVVDVNDPSKPTGPLPARLGSAELRAIKTKLAQIIAGLFMTTATNTNPYGLVNLLHPSANDKGRSIIASGWDFCGRNQQWGGSPTFYGGFVDSATGTAFDFTSFDGYIEDDGSVLNVGAAAGNFYRYQVITPPKNLSLSEVWVKLFKNGNPVDNATLQLYSVAAGIPNALIATFNVINGKQITSDTNGQWYRFTLVVVQALVAGTQYVLVLSKSAGVDAANFYNWKGKTTTKYPSNLAGTGTNVPAFTAGNTISGIFLAVSQVSDQVLQSGGQFDWLLQGYDANPVNRGGAICQDLKNLKWNPKKGTVLIRGASFTKGKPFFDALYGLHHDRLVAYSDGVSGLGKVSIFQQNGTVTTVVGTTDISTANFKDISIEYQCLGTGADYLRLRVNGIVEGSITLQSFVMDPLWGQLGTAWLMGGFNPTFTSASYSKLSTMGVLPSADGWTFTTSTATVEGNVFAISGGKLNQIKAGMAAGGDGLYKIVAPGFVNATGHSFITKTRCVSNSNTKDAAGHSCTSDDGVKRLVLDIQEYFCEPQDNPSYIQQDYKTVDNVFIGSIKGTDAYVFINGRFSHDRTALAGATVGGLSIQFGDLTTTANENADAIWNYFGYLNTGPILPQFSSCTLSEFAYWQEDASAIMAALYNAGASLSVKTYAGIEKNWIGEDKVQKLNVRGITVGPTTASTIDVVLPEMEGFITGSEIYQCLVDTEDNTTAGQWAGVVLYVDGIPVTVKNPGSISQEAPALFGPVVAINKKQFYFGLHKVEGRWSVSANTGNSLNAVRTMQSEARV